MKRENEMMERVVEEVRIAGSTMICLMCTNTQSQIVQLKSWSIGL